MIFQLIVCQNSIHFGNTRILVLKHDCILTCGFCMPSVFLQAVAVVETLVLVDGATVVVALSGVKQPLITTVIFTCFSGLFLMASMNIAI